MAENEPRIPYGRQYVDEFDVAAVTEVLRGDWLTQGPHVERFEQAVATRVQARHAIAFANGTAALHGACVAAGLGPGSTVATSALSFAASANCAKYVGAEVEFVDIDPDTLCMDTEPTVGDHRGRCSRAGSVDRIWSGRQLCPLHHDVLFVSSGETGDDGRGRRRDDERR